MEGASLLRVRDALLTIRCGAVCSEERLHELTACALAEAGMDARHEVRLAPRCRIDFRVGNVGIEIKKNKPDRTKLIAQLERYAACEQVGALLVVTPRGVRLPKSIHGKQVSMLALESLWGISLP